MLTQIKTVALAARNRPSCRMRLGVASLVVMLMVALHLPIGF